MNRYAFLGLAVGWITTPLLDNSISTVDIVVVVVLCAIFLILEIIERRKQRRVKKEIRMAKNKKGKKTYKKIGLSLSLCVEQMIRQGISENDIDKIIAGTNAPDDEAFEEVLESYTKVYWKEFPKKAKALARRLKKAGKIEQPRTEGKPVHSIADGIWVDSEDEIRPS